MLHEPAGSCFTVTPGWDAAAAGGASTCIGAGSGGFGSSEAGGVSTSIAIGSAGFWLLQACGAGV